MNKEHYQANTYPFGLLISCCLAPTYMCCLLKNQYFIAYKKWASEQPDAPVAWIFFGAPLGQMEGIDAQSYKSSLGTEKSTHSDRAKVSDLSMRSW
jgi:hypothetical protein